VSDGTQSPSGGGSTQSRSATKTASTKAASTKAMRRAAMERAAAQRAKARHRRNLIISALTVVLVAGLVIVIATNHGKAKKAVTSASGAPSAEAQAGPAANFPPLPPGADPALKTKPTVAAGTGALTKLVVTPIVQGTGAAVQAGQTITVNYVGVTYKDAKEFDSSWKRSETFPVQIGTGQVIPGWDQGLVGVKVGSLVQLDIPSELAYGDDGQIPGPLRFIVDILAAK
jgi:peptidylprolyl isomerase